MGLGMLAWSAQDAAVRPPAGHRLYGAALDLGIAAARAAMSEFDTLRDAPAA